MAFGKLIIGAGGIFAGATIATVTLSPDVQTAVADAMGTLDPTAGGIAAEAIAHAVGYGWPAYFGSLFVLLLLTQRGAIDRWLSLWAERHHAAAIKRDGLEPYIGLNQGRQASAPLYVNREGQ